MSKKKVLHVVKVMNHGGAETMIMNIYRNIDRDKIQFDFLCLSNIEGDYEKEITELGGQIYKLPEPKEQGRLKNFYNIYKIMKQNNKYDVVHSHIMFYTGFINFIAYIAGIRIRISHSHSASDIKKENFIRKIYMKIARSLNNKFSNVKIACGEKAGRYLYGKKEKFIILKNGIELDKYIEVNQEEKNKLKNELEIKENELVIGHVGRFEKVKNHKFFIELAKKLKKLNVKFKIVLVGTGSTFEEILHCIKEEELDEFFVLPGMRNDINVFMNIFDVFIMPSLYEGFPLVVVEALAGDNICYLSNNISKETEVIKSRVNFFDLKINIDDLYSKIEYDLRNKETFDIKKLLEEKGFSIKKMTKDIMDIYIQ